MRKRQIFTVSLLVLMMSAFSLSGFGHAQATASDWAATPPKIDGLDKDWEGVTLIPQKYGVNLGFRNDENYLYILFQFTDPKYLTTVEATGMTVFFNTEGKKKKDHGINFRKMRLTADQFIAMMEQKQGPLPENQKANLRLNPFYWMFHYGIISKDSKELLTAEEHEDIMPAVFRSQVQQQTVIYEFAVPLERATEFAPGIGTRPGEEITVGFEWGGWIRELKEAVASGMGATGARARDQRASDDLKGEGGDPSDVRGMSIGDAPELAAMRKKQPPKYTFWVDIELAAKE